MFAFIYNYIQFSNLITVYILSDDFTDSSDLINLVFDTEGITELTEKTKSDMIFNIIYAIFLLLVNILGFSLGFYLNKVILIINGCFRVINLGISVIFLLISGNQILINLLGIMKLLFYDLGATIFVIIFSLSMNKRKKMAKQIGCISLHIKCFKYLISEAIIKFFKS